MKAKQQETSEKIIMSEKQKEVIYCVFFLIVLLFLAFGDRVILHFITKQPNPNPSISRGEQEASSIPVFMEELNISDILNKLNNQETFVLLSTRDNCYTCKSYIPLLEEEFAKYDITAYYMNRSLYDLNNDEFVAFTKTNENIEKNLQYTPYIMYFKEGVLQDELIGSKERIEIDEFIQKNELENNKI